LSTKFDDVIRKNSAAERLSCFFIAFTGSKSNKPVTIGELQIKIISVQSE